MMTKYLVNYAERISDEMIFLFKKNYKIGYDENEINKLKNCIKDKIMCNEIIDNKINNVSCHTCGN